MTEQVKTERDRELPRPGFSLFRQEHSDTEPKGWIVSCICARLIWLGFRRDAVDKTGRWACSAAVPHGALRASYCHSTRPFGTRYARRAPRRRCFPVPPCHLLLCRPPSCYFTFTALLLHCNPNSGRMWLMCASDVDYRLSYLLMWHKPGVGLLIKSRCTTKTFSLGICYLLHHITEIVKSQHTRY